MGKNYISFHLNLHLFVDIHRIFYFIIFEYFYLFVDNLYIFAIVISSNIVFLIVFYRFIELASFEYQLVYFDLEHINQDI